MHAAGTAACCRQGRTPRKGVSGVGGFFDDPREDFVLIRGRHRSVLFMLVVVAAAAVVAAGPGVATASSDLGPIGFGAVVVDDARAQVLVSGPSANVVEVLDFGGTVVRTIPDVYGAWGMVVSGRYLYVAESTAGTVVRVDLTAPTSAPTTIAKGLLQPRWLVMTGGKLWTTVAAPAMSGWGSIASVDLKSGKLTTFSQSYYSPDLAVSPALPSTIFLAEDGLSPGAVYRIDVSSAKPKVRASNTFTDQANIEDLAVSPDGKRVIPASGYPYLFEELSASTLQPDGLIYPGNPYPSAVAVSPGRSGLLATGLDNGYSSPDIAVFPLGTPTPLFTATTMNSSGTANVRPHGLALSMDGSTLFAVSANDVYGTDTVVDAFALP
jgi:hypothetical protein